MKTNILHNIINNVRVYAITMVCLMTLGVGNAWGTTSTLTLKSSTSQTSPYEDANGVTWTFSGVTFVNDNNACINKTNGTLTITPPTGAIVTQVSVTKTGNAWAGAAQLNFYVGTSGTAHTTLTSSSSATTDISITSTDQTAGSYKFTNTTDKNCWVASITITYTVASDPYTVNFNAQGGTCGTASLTEASGGAGVTLPAASPSAACASEGWGFYGWATSEVGSSTTTAPTIVGKAGDTYHPASDNITLHAVYAQGEYTKETSSITSGAKYLIVGNTGGHNYIMKSSSDDMKDYSGYTGMEGAQVDETSSGKYHVSAVNPNWCYTIEGSIDAYYIRDVINNSSSNYLDLYFDSFWGKSYYSEDSYTITVSSGIWSIMHNDQNSYLGFDDSDLAFFAYNSTMDIYLYKAGTINYYSSPSCCNKEVAVSYNSAGSTNISNMTFSAASTATCGGESTREVTVTVTPSSGYFMKSGDRLPWSKTSGTIPADPTYVSGPTDNGNGTWSFVYRFAQNDNGAGTFAAAASTYTNYKTKCCTPLATLNGAVSWSGGNATVSWDAAGGCGSWVLKYKRHADSDIPANWTTYDGSTGTAAGRTSNSTAISGLIAGTEYDFQISGTSDGSVYCSGAVGQTISSTVPKILASSSMTDLGYQEGDTPEAQTFTVSGTQLTGDLTVTAPSNFLVSLDGSAWSAAGGSKTITVTTPPNDLGTTTIYVKANSGLSQGDDPSGNIVISGGGAANVNVAVEATITEACTAPNHVDISGRWDRFGGETLSLTATAYSSAGTESPIAAGSITGYQWQKLVSTTWTNVTGANVSGATSNNLVITNCTKDNSGKYRCVINTGESCSTASATATDGSEGYGVKVYVLECYTGGTTTYNFTRNGDTQSGTLTFENLTCNTDYTFKVHADGYYGNNGTINTNVTNWVWSTSGGNCTIKSGYGGDITIDIDYSTGGNSSVEGEPEISVTYEDTKTIYIAAGDYADASAKIAIYYWSSGGNGWTDFLTTTTCSNGRLVATLPAWTQQFCIVRFDPVKGSTGNWDNKWNQTNDINISCSYDQYSFSSWCSGDGCKETFTAGTFVPLTYTVSFAGNGSDGGSMSSLSSIACDASQALTANAFTKTGYTFSHWTANVDVKVGGAMVDAGDPIADEATIQNITSNITLTAQWTANKYDVTLKPNGGSGSDQTVQATYDLAMPLTVKTAGTAIVVPTLTGYNFNGYWDDASSGTQYYDYTGSPKTLGSARNWDKTAATNLYAHWTAKQTTVSFDQNSGTGGQTSSVTATYDAAMPTPITCPTREGHTFAGYYESTGGTGKQYYAANGSSANNWDKEDATWTLYAKWNVNNYTLAWSWDGGSTSSTTHTAAGLVAYGTTLVYPDNATMSKTGYSFTGWSSTPSTMPATNTTITAQWSLNSYNVAVQNVSDVTIKATPSGGSAISERSNADVAYNTTITLNYSSKASSVTWGGWRVTKADDPSVIVFNGTVNNATFDMPAYDVNVSAYVYGDLKAWCDPDVTVTGDVYLTSTKDVPVRYSTSGSDNLVTISGSDMGSATTMEVAYLNADAADAEVDKDDSPFRFYKADGSATTETLDLDYEWETSHPISYTPSAYSVTNNYKLQLNFKKGDKVLKTLTHAIHGRGLPEEFVIAVKKGGVWVALPSNLASTSAQPSIIPRAITVNDNESPTTAIYAPTTTVYKAKSRGNDAHISTIRFTTTGSNYLQVSGTASEYNMWLSSTNSANVQDWQLKTSDGNAYEVTIPSNSTTKEMGIYNSTYMGYHGSPNNANIYFLPITNKYDSIYATVYEWGEHGAIIAPKMASLASLASATMHVANGSPAAATLTAVNATSLTEGKYIRVYNEDLTVGNISNENKQLYVHWKNSGGTDIGVSQVTIPRVIASDRTANKTNDDNKNVWNTEVHVLPGATLTIDGNTFVTGTTNSTVSVNELYVYPGATINVSTGKLSASTLRLRNGWTRAGAKQYNTARVYIADDAALEKTTASMDYDIYEASDGKHYYPLAVPFATAVNMIDYADTYLAGFSTYGTHYVIKEYNGLRRAQSGPDQANNWTPVAEDGTLQPGKGYIMTGVGLPAYGGCIIRVPLTFDNGWTSDGEKATYSAVTKNVVPVTAYGGAAATAHQRHKGWNMLGVPFMSSYGAGTDMYSGGGAAALINGELVVNTSASENMEYQSTAIPYVSVPSHDFAEYVQTDISEATLLPGWSFFVQVNTDGNLTFAVSDRRPDEDNPIYAPRRSQADEVLRTGIILSGADASDKTTILVSDRYNGAEYEIGADLEKMFGNGYTLATYSLSGETRLAYNAMSKSEAQGMIPIGFRAPEDGEYTFSLNPRYADAPFERVDLIDYQTGELTNMLTSSYTFAAERTQNDTRFALNVVMKKDTPTDIETVGGEMPEVNGVRKLLINDKLYIIRGGQMYDATGKRVMEINK